jgi:glycosyltransferase involved in cell wall biosynthesis
VALTPEILHYERERCRNPQKPGFVYPNGIVFSNGVCSDERGEVTEMLFVASHFAAWHGLDLLIDAAQASTEKFLVHIVGDVCEEDRLRLIGDPRFVVHGKMTHEEIAAIAGRCWVGLSSLALFRKKMEEACTIKVREYLMMGLPVYAGYRDVFLGSFPYYRQGSADFAEIILFGHQMRLVGRGEVVALSRRHIDKCALLAKLYAWLISGFENSNPS